MKKIMSELELLQLLPASPAEVEASNADIIKTLGSVSPGYYQRGIEQGWLKCLNLAINGENFYRVFFQVIDGKTLHVLMAHAVSRESDFNLLIRGVNDIAALNGCQRIEFVTRRKGLAIQMQEHDYSVKGVVMEKTV